MSIAPSRPMRAARAAPEIRLGLIGDNIARSRSPDLHRIAGRLNGIDVAYDLFIPRDLGKDFDAVFEMCRAGGIRGVNITYPYKEMAAARVTVEDAMIRRIGSVNTVVFEAAGAFGYNTDYTGFAAAYRTAFGEMPPGRVVLIGAGGVGKAVAFGLLELGAGELRIVDRDAARAEALANTVGRAAPGTVVSVAANVALALADADGAVNCTPVGMVGYPGSPAPRASLAGLSWAFDAVYTPVETEFISDATTAGLKILSGYELFFHQGVQAFEIFTGRPPADLAQLRRELADESRD